LENGQLPKSIHMSGGVKRSVVILIGRGGVTMIGGGYGGGTI